MNNKCNLPDTQNSPDMRNIVINKVGIKDIKYPFDFIDNGISQSTIGQWTMGVELPDTVKGTHMSRFIEILNAKKVIFSLGSFEDLLFETKKKLETNNVFIDVNFSTFVQKTAPISKAKSLLDYQVFIEGSLHKENIEVYCKVIIPVTSLCPCSKKISEYGAHNQRSHITLKVLYFDGLSVKSLIDIAEKSASSQLYAILKREDEKFVTEEAYKNPAFVEDLVRDIAVTLNEMDIQHYKIESENFESIHNHSAYAMIEK
ncbi:GTP cyclohydrolase I type 2 [hydrothermal vent metagenome]|uniref:GTP cyclohydrolase I type 2 n=1 Tax=hydrothermal vent metagenome TaxID=652676 RepID=A0A1W1CLX7_9ZZZZ